MRHDDRRLEDMRRFYRILKRLETKIGGLHALYECNGRMDWPARGVYFFCEEGERRTDTGRGLRVVRLGTHAITENARSTLWRRLYAHSIGRSVFGGLIRRALGERYGIDNREFAANAISSMPFLWLAVDDEPGPDSDRGYIERNAIALLSNYNTCHLDPPSRNWLGHCSDSHKVARSGLWNANHVTQEYDSDFLDTLAQLVGDQRRSRER